MLKLENEKEDLEKKEGKDKEVFLGVVNEIAKKGIVDESNIFAIAPIKSEFLLDKLKKNSQTATNWLRNDTIIWLDNKVKTSVDSFNALLKILELFNTGKTRFSYDYFNFYYFDEENPIVIIPKNREDVAGIIAPRI